MGLIRLNDGCGCGGRLILLVAMLVEVMAVRVGVDKVVGAIMLEAVHPTGVHTARRLWGLDPTACPLYGTRGFADGG